VEPDALIPMQAETLARLEKRRAMWEHSNFEQTIALMLDVLDYSETQAAETLAALQSEEPAAAPATGPTA